MSKTSRLNRLIGSLKMAVLLLVAIAAVLAWGTIYEVRYGTASVQRFIYQSWWFQLLLTFLGVNLAVAAFQRMPWRKQHAPFLLAHLGIILILTGGVIGGRFGIDGQLVIQEGQAERVLLMPNKVLAIEQPNPGVQRIIPTRFETQAWVQQPNLTVPVMLESGDQFMLTVDKYYPDASFDEDIQEGGDAGPAALMQLWSDESPEDQVWLFARDPERFGVGWGEAHVLFLDLPTAADAKPFLEPPAEPESGRGRLLITLPNRPEPVVVPVPDRFDPEPVPVGDTGYTIRFKEYFPDFTITPDGPATQSDQPNNPALALLLSGPEGQDAHLVFARHPDIGSMHGWAKQINAQVRYEHGSTAMLPPNAMAVLRLSDGLAGVFTGADSRSRHVVRPLTPGEAYTHPDLGYHLRVAKFIPNAHRHVQVTNRTQEVRSEALHVVVMPLGTNQTASAQTAWLTPGEPLELTLPGDHTLRLTYGPEQRELPFTVKLLDFRKIDYPGISMAAGFESDVQLTDTERGMILMRTIKMNEPLKHRGYSLFQSSFIPGPVETTVLSVRNDPGTPLVYAGFLTVIAGVVAMFIMRRSGASRAARAEAS